MYGPNLGIIKEMFPEWTDEGSRHFHGSTQNGVLAVREAIGTFLVRDSEEHRRAPKQVILQGSM